MEKKKRKARKTAPSHSSDQSQKSLWEKRRKGKKRYGSKRKKIHLFRINGLAWAPKPLKDLYLNYYLHDNRNTPNEMNIVCVQYYVLHRYDRSTRKSFYREQRLV